RICSPHCGVDPETTSGGETYERELLRHLGAMGHPIELLLARHKRYPEGVSNWTIHRLPVGRGLRWPLAALILPTFIRRLYDRPGFDLLRAHSLRYIGPAALIARHGLSGKVVALFLGGLKERKNLFFLLDVWREVARAGGRAARRCGLGPAPWSAQAAHGQGRPGRPGRLCGVRPGAREG